MEETKYFLVHLEPGSLKSLQSKPGWTNGGNASTEHSSQCIQLYPGKSNIPTYRHSQLLVFLETCNRNTGLVQFWMSSDM